jgi:hypothetical protein
MISILRIGYGYAITCFLSLNVALAAAQVTSVYTDLSGKNCKLIEMDKETGSSVRRCPGVGGFHLSVAEDDARMSVNVISPNHTEHPLDYWDIITHSFSSLGKKAEWRIAKHRGKVMPIALIVRVNSFEQEESEYPKKKSYLAIAKISPEEICVTDKIRSGMGANEEARRAADSSAKKECIKP